MKPYGFLIWSMLSAGVALAGEMRQQQGDCSKQIDAFLPAYRLQYEEWLKPVYAESLEQAKFKQIADEKAREIFSQYARILSKSDYAQRRSSQIQAIKDRAYSPLLEKPLIDETLWRMYSNAVSSIKAELKPKRAAGLKKLFEKADPDSVWANENDGKGIRLFRFKRSEPGLKGAAPRGKLQYRISPDIEPTYSLFYLEFSFQTPRGEYRLKHAYDAVGNQVSLNPEMTYKDHRMGGLEPIRIKDGKPVVPSFEAFVRKSLPIEDQYLLKTCSKDLQLSAHRVSADLQKVVQGVGEGASAHEMPADAVAGAAK